MRKYLALLIVFYLFFNSAAAQIVNDLGRGLATSPLTVCSDSLGNIYAVTGDRYGTRDSLTVQKWDAANRTWSKYALLVERYHTRSGRSMACGFINNTFYLMYIYNNFYFIKKYVSGTWSDADIYKALNESNYISLNSFKYKNRIYLFGAFDTTIAQTGSGDKQVAVIDNNGVTDAGFPNAYKKTICYGMSADTLRDTMYVTAVDKILYHVAPSTWGVYCNIPFKMQSGYQSLVAGNGQLYLASFDSIIIIKNKKVVVSIPNTQYSKTILGVNRNKVISRSGDGLFRYTDFNSGLNFKVTGRNETFFDSAEIVFVRTPSDQLYYYGSTGVIFGGTNYNNIAELLGDSMRQIKLDTVLVKVFRDRNKNLVYDGSDTIMNSSGVMMNNFTFANTDAKGEYIFYILENENPYFWFYSENGITDTCYKPFYPGGQSSRTYNSPRTRDTILMPLWRTSAYGSNLNITAGALGQVRLNDPTELKIYYQVKNCDYENVSGTVTVTLQNKFTYVSSTPAPTSKSGNVLTYNFNNLYPDNNYINNWNNKISIKGYYANTDFKFGDTVYHQVKIKSNKTEADTSDNRYTIRQRLVYSYDPNVKTSIPEGKITQNVKSVIFHIDFQNEGNDYAGRVTIVDTLDLKLHALYYRLCGSSHKMRTEQVSNNVIKFIFDDINLLPKSQNEALSKGFVEFEAYVGKGLAVGDSIRNKAHIYFDFNEPVITPYAVINRIADNGGGLYKVYNTASFQLYPNPTGGVFNLTNESNTLRRITLYNIEGKVMDVVEVKAGTSVALDSSQWASGLYLAVGDDGTAVKFIVE